MKVKQFVRADRRKFIIFATFMFIAFAGYTQSWVFSGKDIGLPKPLLFDLFAPFPFWIIWTTLLLPLGLLSNVIVAIGGYKADFIMRGPFWLFVIINLAYFYMLSCLITFIWDKFKTKK